MEIAIIILLVIIAGFLISDRFRRGQKLKEQGDALSKAVGERIDGTIKVFGDLKESLGELTQRTKAIVCVHYGGYPCDMEKILSIAKKHNLKVITDDKK